MRLTEHDYFVMEDFFPLANWMARRNKFTTKADRLPPSEWINKSLTGNKKKHPKLDFASLIEWKFIAFLVIAAGNEFSPASIVTWKHWYVSRIRSFSWNFRPRGQVSCSSHGNANLRVSTVSTSGWKFILLGPLLTLEDYEFMVVFYFFFRFA